jgi:hypothetical protein
MYANAKKDSYAMIGLTYVDRLYTKTQQTHQTNHLDQSDHNEYL